MTLLCLIPAFAQPDGAVDEMLDLRTSSSKTRLNADGSRTAEISSMPIHYLDSTGVWQEIDTNLVPAVKEGFGASVIKNSFKTHLAVDAKGRHEIEFDDIVFSFTADAVSSSIGVAEGDTITYTEAWPSTDLSYKVLPTCIKEELILRQQPEVSEFRFIVNAGGLEPVTAGRGMDFLDSEGIVRIRIPGPFMQDADGELSDAVEATWEELPDGRIELTLQPDSDWLSNAAYPVIIDPTITIAPYMGQGIDSHYDLYTITMTGTRYDTGFLKFGRNTGTRRDYSTCIRWDTSGIGTNAVVTDAVIGLQHYIAPPATCSVGLKRITDWPWPSTTLPERGEILETIEWPTTGGYKFFTSEAVNDMVQGWIWGSIDNYGVEIDETTGASITVQCWPSESEPPLPGGGYSDPPSLAPRLTFTYELDTEPPTVVSVSSPDYESGESIRVDYETSDTDGGGTSAVSGVKQVTLYYKKGGGDWTEGETKTEEDGYFEFDGMTGDDTYYFDVIAEDNAGNLSALEPTVRDSTVYDTTPPSTPVVTDDGDYTTSSSELHATWTEASDAESGVIGYKYAIGTTPEDPGTGYFVDWTPVGLALEVTAPTPPLVNGQIYYFYIKAVNGAGSSSVGISDGIRVIESVGNIDELYSKPDGTYIQLDDKIVTAGSARIDGALYMQEQVGVIPQAGIKVLTDISTIEEAVEVSVIGCLQTDVSTTERMINADWIEITFPFFQPQLPLETVNTPTEVFNATARRVEASGTVSEVLPDDLGYMLDTDSQAGNDVKVTTVGLRDPTVTVSLGESVRCIGICTRESGGLTAAILPTNKCPDCNASSSHNCPGTSISAAQYIASGLRSDGQPWSNQGGVLLFAAEYEIIGDWIPIVGFDDTLDSNEMNAENIHPCMSHQFSIYYPYYWGDSGEDWMERKRSVSISTLSLHNGSHVIKGTMGGGITDPFTGVSYYFSQTDCVSINVDNLLVTGVGSVGTSEPRIVRFDGVNPTSTTVSISDGSPDHGPTTIEMMVYTIPFILPIYQHPSCYVNTVTTTVPVDVTEAEITWDGRNNYGQLQPPGFYAISVKAYHNEWVFRAKEPSYPYGRCGYTESGELDVEKYFDPSGGPIDEGKGISDHLFITFVGINSLTKTTEGINVELQYLLSGSRNASSCKLTIYDPNGDTITPTSVIPTQLPGEVNVTSTVNFTFTPNGSGNYYFIISAVDDNPDDEKGHRKMPATSNGDWFMLVKIDIDIDSNNDGIIDETDDLLEDTPPGCAVALNDDDDNQNGIADFNENPVSDEDDLANLEISYAPEKAGYKVRLGPGAGGASSIKVWDSTTKDNQITLPKTWVIGQDTIPSILYVEGIVDGQATLNLQYLRPDDVVVDQDCILVTVVNATVVSPTEVTKVLISKRSDTGDSYPSIYQTEDRKIVITASTAPGISGRKVYFKSNDPDDKSPYEPDTDGGDNSDGVGTLTPAPGYTGGPGYVYTDANGIAKAVLEITDNCAGDNYVVTVNILSDPTPLNDSSGTLVAWKRIYIEQDKMFRTGTDLSLDFTADGDDDPDSITLVDISALSQGDSIVVFDADHPEGENATITSINGNTIILNVDLQNSYDAGYNPGKGAAVGKPSDGYFDADLGLLTNAFGSDVEGTDGGTFVEFIRRDDGSGIVPYRHDLRFKFQVEPFKDVWFKNKGKSNYLCILGAEAQRSGSCFPDYNFQWIGVAWVEQWGPTSVAELTCHETAHQFLGSTTTDGNHLTQQDGTDLWCHLGPHITGVYNSDRCLTGYDSWTSDGITEFCAQPSDQSVCHHLKDVREMQDGL